MSVRIALSERMVEKYLVFKVGVLAPSRIITELRPMSEKITKMAERLVR